MSDESDFGPELTGDPCFDAVNVLFHYLDGELTEARRTTISTHIEVCGSCLSTYSFQTELRTVVRTRSITKVPDALRARIANELGL